MVPTQENYCKTTYIYIKTHSTHDSDLREKNQLDKEKIKIKKYKHNNNFIPLAVECLWAMGIRFKNVLKRIVKE